MMRRWICSLLCALFLCMMIPLPAVAQTPEAEAVGNGVDQQLQQANEIAQKAYAATDQGDFATAEQYWTQLIDILPTNPAAWSNRGNSRVSQNKLEEAIADYNESIRLAPDAPDPYLNRGTAYEAQGRYEDAIEDYNYVLELAPNDAMAYNNRGTAKAGQGKYEDAIADYQKAVALAPNFAFARANAALLLYQIGKEAEAEQEIRNLVRKYPMFPDMRAALSAILWSQGKQGEAESNWVAALGIDGRYQDLDWVKNVRRWPPRMVVALEKFLNLD